MPLTIGSMASMASNMAMNQGVASANSLGLGEDSASALAIGNLMDDEDQGMGLLGKSGLGASVVNKTLGLLNKDQDNKLGGITPSIQDQKNIIGAGLGLGGSLIDKTI